MAFQYARPFVSKSIWPRITIILAVVFAFSSLSHAQDYIYGTGKPTFTSAEAVEMGILNTSNGNLHLEIPLAQYSQRGSLPFQMTLVYDSRIWKIVGGAWQPTNVANSQGGWRLITTANAGVVGHSVITDVCGDPPNVPFYTIYTGFSWTDPAGTRHTFPVETLKDHGCGAGDISTDDAFANDSTGYHMYITGYFNATVFAPDGTQVYPSLKDTNGNYFSFDVNGNAIDTLGRTPVVKSTDPNNSKITYYDILDSRNSPRQRITVTSQDIDVSTAFGQSGVTEASTQVNVITSISLPDGTSYNFSYDSGPTPGNYGLLKTVTLPTGGQINYTFTTFSDYYGNRNRWLDTKAAGGGTWTYMPSLCTGACQQLTVTKPSGDQVVHKFTLNNGAWDNQTDYKDSSGTVLLTQLTDYDFSDPNGNYIRTVRNTTQVPSSSGTLLKKTEYLYDSSVYGRITQISEWNYYTGTPSAQPDRLTEIAYKHTTDANYLNKNMLDKVVRITHKNASGSTVAENKFYYDGRALTSVTGVAQHDDANFGTSNTIRGNATTVQTWRGGTDFLGTSLWYDTTGQITQVQDPNSNIATLSYTDNFFHDSGGNPPASYTPPAPAHAFPTTVTLPLIGSASFGYFYNTGKLAVSTDQNGATSYFHFLDALDRLTQASLPGGGWVLNQYSATQKDTYVGITSPTPSTSCGSCVHAQAVVDGLDRLSSQILVNDPEGADIVATSYDSSGRASAVTTPYRSPTEPTSGTESFAYDALDRTVTTTHKDTNHVQVFYGPAVTATIGRTTRACTGTTLAYPAVYVDEAGKKRETWTDGFGRILEVNEPDDTGALTIHTCYTYDSVDNLLTAVQRGGSANSSDWRTRTYTYDQVGRVTSASVPETGPSASSAGTTTFYYTDVSGALCSGDSSQVCRRTDPRNITTTYSYDGLNRLTSKTYSNGDPQVQYFYDQTAYNGLTISNGKGRRTGMSDASGQAAWSYDAAGRIVAERRTISGITKAFSFSYNYDGSLASITYPSGRIVNYTYSNAGRVTDLKDPARTAYYFKDAKYTAAGLLSTAFQGQVPGGQQGITITNSFSNRLQPVTLSAASSTLTLLSLTYSFNLGNDVNNGSVAVVQNNRDLNRSIQYSYDAMNRLKEAYTPNSSLWGNSYVYDGWGNLLQKNAMAGKTDYEPLNVAVTNKNRIVGMTYDDAGNLTNDGVHTYTYNAENQTTASAGKTYLYDGDNKRVQKSGYRIYWTGPTYSVLAESDLAGTLNKEYFYVGSRLIGFRSVATDTVYYYLPDYLGSAVVVANGSGSSIQEESDFYPWGGERVIADHIDNRYKFASYEWDPESGNHYAVFRQYSSRLGRFMSVDPVDGAASNPSSLNRFAYVWNNPTNLLDRFGLCPPGEIEKGRDDSGEPICEPIEPNVNDAGPGNGNGCTISFGLFSFSFSACPFRNRPGGRIGRDPHDHGGTPDPRQSKDNKCGGTGGGVGVTAAANLDAGAIAAGASATGSAGAGVFFDSKKGLSAGALATGGAAAFAGSHVAAAPSQSRSDLSAFGLFGGLGGAFFVTNASSVQQLRGNFSSLNLNVGYSLAQLQVQFAKSGDIWYLQISPPKLGLSLGLSATTMKTNTITTHTGCQ